MDTKPHGNSVLERPGLVAAGRRIEEESFRIIDSEMGPNDFSPEHRQIVRRVIHTTGDFDYARQIRIHPQVVEAAMAALRAGAPIIADTRMIGVGLAPWRLVRFGNEVVVPATLPESRKWAEEAGTTLSVAAFRHVADRIRGGIVAVGNAPTALLETLRLAREEGIRPAVVIGVPVGFVQAEESKNELFGMSDLPSVTVLGRKGGSTVAVAILHALMELTGTEPTQQ